LPIIFVARESISCSMPKTARAARGFMPGLASSFLAGDLQLASRLADAAEPL
jgi:hypothetical protein